MLPLLSLFSRVRLCVTPETAAPLGSPIPGILQARTLVWVTISFSNAGKWKVKVKSLSRVRLLVTPWTAAYQAPPSMGFSRQENWSGLLYIVTKDFFLVMRSFKIYSFSNFQICNIVLLKIATTLYITSPWLAYFVSRSLHLLIPLTHFVTPL